MSDADQVEVAIKKEDNFGEDPGGDYNVLRITSESLQQDSNYEASSELRSDRQTADTRRMSIAVSGDINFELSYETFDDLIAAALMSSWDTNTLENGTTFESFAIQRHYKDIGEVALFLGCGIDEMSLQIQNQNYITGSFSIMGIEQSFLASANSVTAANSNPLFTAAENVDSIQLSGSDVETLEWTLNIQNNLRERPLVASLQSDTFGKGNLIITGTVQSYFKTKAIMEDYLDAQAISQQAAMTDPDGNSLTIDLPRVRYTEGSNPPSGQNSDIIAELSYQAVVDPVEGHMIQITRAAAV